MTLEDFKHWLAGFEQGLSVRPYDMDESDIEKMFLTIRQKMSQIKITEQNPKPVNSEASPQKLPIQQPTWHSNSTVEDRGISFRDEE